MKREGGKFRKEEIFKEEDILFLNQLVKTLEEVELKLTDSYNKKDYENFNKSKKLILSVQRKISEIVK